jgi:large subunit ribosomal protein L15
MPLQRRIPKRGFTNRNRTEYQVVNVGRLDRIDGDDVSPETLRAHGLVRSLRKPVKILGVGEVDRAFSVRTHGISASARAKIEAAGGSVELISVHPAP